MIYADQATYQDTRNSEGPMIRVWGCILVVKIHDRKERKQGSPSRLLSCSEGVNRDSLGLIVLERST